MRKGRPIIAEDADILKQQLQHELDGRKQPRLQMGYLPASGQAQTRLEVAQLLGPAHYHPENTRPERVFRQDESRAGLLTVRRRGGTALRGCDQAAKRPCHAAMADDVLVDRALLCTVA
jgi:hypothetical protein